MREIQRLRQEQEIHARNTAEVQYSPTLMVELRQLRQRKEELERRMGALQENRRELMVQLEGLMNLLKVSLPLLSYGIACIMIFKTRKFQIYSSYKVLFLCYIGIFMLPHLVSKLVNIECGIFQNLCALMEVVFPV